LLIHGRNQLFAWCYKTHHTCFIAIRKSEFLPVFSNAQQRRIFKLISPLQRTLAIRQGIHSLSDCRAIGLSDCRAIGLSDCRAIGLSDYRTIGLSDCRTLGLSDYRTV